MATVELTAAFSSVPAGDAEAIKRLLVETVEQIARDDASFERAKLVFTESDERCGLTAELDGVKREGVQPPKAGSRFFARHLDVRAGERVLELGAGLGLAAVLAARAGAHVVATDVMA